MKHLTIESHETTYQKVTDAKIKWFLFGAIAGVLIMIGVDICARY